MRWKKKRHPNVGDIRIKTKFAFLPTKLNDGYTVWLEKYEIIEEYTVRIIHDHKFNGEPYSYDEFKWELVRTKIIN
jgi:hypothetical protein